MQFSFLALATVSVLALSAQDTPVGKGFAHFYNLEYDQAIEEFDRAIAQNPKSPDPHNHVAQTLLFREMYHNGALESELVSGNNPFLRRQNLNVSPAVSQRFDREIENAMRLSQAQLDKNPKDTHALYSLGVAYGLRANYNFLVKKSWREALGDATSGRKLHNKVTEMDPSNYDARLMQGVHDYVVGSLPWGWRFLGFLAGFRGDREKGLVTLNEVARKGDHNRIDAEVILCALYRRENKPKLALPLLEDLLARFPRNHLLYFETSQMYSQLGNKDKAIAAVEKVAELKKAGSPGYSSLPWEKIYFQIGVIQFWYNDLDRSLDNLKKVTATPSDVDLNTGAQAWMRMGQIYDMTRRRPQAVEAYRRAIAFAPQADAAREARAYLSTPYKREKS